MRSGISRNATSAANPPPTIAGTFSVPALRPPVPLELMPFGLAATIRRLAAIGPVRRRDAPSTPDGNVLADFEGAIDDPAQLSSALDAVPGVMGHGLFPPEIVSEVLVGVEGGRVDRLTQ